MNNNFKYIILNSCAIKHYTPETDNALLIQILEPRYKEAGIPFKIKHEYMYKEHYRIYIDDVRDELPESIKNSGRFKIFNAEDAVELKEFLMNNNFDEIVIHCNAGLSRSPAIMYYIAKIFNREDIITEIKNNKSLSPNPLILKVCNDSFN